MEAGYFSEVDCCKSGEYFEKGESTSAEYAFSPESAGAHPGPVCYRKVNGQLAVTDANVVLGRIVPELFPKIFGADQKQPIDAEASRTAMAQLCEEVRKKFLFSLLW